jgi:hypothetical protein
MSIIGSELLLGAAGAGGYEIERSLRFNSADSAYLGRTPASAGNRKTWTWAAWVKRSRLGVYGLFAAYSTGTFFDWLRFDTSDKLEFYQGNGVQDTSLVTTAAYRDVSAWYHIVLAEDSTQSTASNRVKLYVNGQQVTSFTSSQYLSQNADATINQNVPHTIGSIIYVTPSQYANLYLANVHFIDGQALDPSSFGEFDDNGVWQPIEYSGTYGTNGFYLDFADNSTAAALGTDTSGNGNTWTVNNLSVQAGNGSYVSEVSGTQYGTSYSIVNMFDGATTTYLAAIGTSTTWTPTGGLSFTKLRVRLYQDSGTGQMTFNWSGGSYVLSFTNATANYTWIDVTSNVTSPVTSVQWSTPGTAGPYVVGWEVNDVQLIDYRFGAGNDSLVDSPTNYGEDTGAGGEVRGNYATLNPINKSSALNLLNGNLDATGLTGAASAASSTIALPTSGKWYCEFTNTGSPGIVYGLGISDSGRQTFTNNGILWGEGSGSYYRSSGVIGCDGEADQTGSTYATGDIISIAYDANTRKIWFAKNGTWQLSGNPASGSNEIGTLNSPTGDYFFGFAVTDSGAVTANFGQRPFAYTAPSGFKALCTTNLPEPTIADGSTAMDVKLYTGNGSTQTISGLNFSPDFVWLKARSAAERNVVFDQVRGAGYRLLTDGTESEALETNTLSAFTSDGFSLGVSNGVNGSGTSMVAWTWDAGSSTVTNTQGSITSQVRANASAGFSIVSYTYPASGTFTVGHGLGITPQFVILKIRNAFTNWGVYHASATSTNQNLVLNSTGGVSANTNYWGSSPFTSTTIGGGVNVSGVSGNNAIAYCFAPVAGYSSFGSYVGNGLQPEGPFIYTGFKPAFLMIKISSAALDGWLIMDNKRPSSNLVNKYLYANTSVSEADANICDFCANGFKIRYNYEGTNKNAETYIYAAFAEHPFQSSRAR